MAFTKPIVGQTAWGTPLNASLDYLNDKDVQIGGFNVKEFGALGNDLQNDTTYIQAALDAAAAVGGGVVYFPAGIYRITADLVLYNNITLRGAGKTVSLIKQVTNGEHAISHTSSDDAHVCIEKIGIVGTGSGAGDGIHLSGGPYYDLAIRDVLVQSMGRNGVFLDGVIITILDNVVAQDCGNAGFWIETFTTSTTFNACYANNCGVYGYYMDNGAVQGSAYCSFNGCASDSSPIGYLFRRTTSVAMNGCGSEANATAAFKFEGCLGFTLNSCFVTASDTEGYHFISDTQTSLGGCTQMVMIGCYETGADSGNGLKIASGSTVTTIGCSFDAGTVNNGTLRNVDTFS